MIGRPTWRRLALGLPTILGMAKRGFFIPYRYAETVAPAGAANLYPAVAKLFADYESVFADALKVLADYGEAFARIGAAGSEGAPRFDQDWFPRLDAAMAYALVRRFQPPRIVEVGSGHSTRFVARAVGDGGLPTAITAIDPAPRADIAKLPVTLLREAVPHCGPAPAARRSAHDRFKPYSDAGNGRRFPAIERAAASGTRHAGSYSRHAVA
jgi:hypothetical protein